MLCWRFVHDARSYRVPSLPQRDPNSLDYRCMGFSPAAGMLRKRTFPPCPGVVRQPRYGTRFFRAGDCGLYRLADLAGSVRETGKTELVGPGDRHLGCGAALSCHAGCGVVSGAHVFCGQPDRHCAASGRRRVSEGFLVPALSVVFHGSDSRRDLQCADISAATAGERSGGMGDLISGYPDHP